MGRRVLRSVALAAGFVTVFGVVVERGPGLVVAAAARDHHLPVAPAVALVPAGPPSPVQSASPRLRLASRPAPVWPSAGWSDVELPGAGMAKAGSLPIEVGSS